MSTAETLRQLKLYEKNPELVKELSNDKLAKLVIVTLRAFKTVNDSIESKKLDLDTKLGKQAEDLIKQTKSDSKAVVDDLNKEVRRLIEKSDSTLNETASELERRVQEAIQNIRDGEDGIVSDEEIGRAATLAAELIELPDFEQLVSTEITTNGAAIRDALELLQGDDRYKVMIEDVEGLADALRNLREIRAATGGAGTNKEAVVRFVKDAIADGVISTGSSLPTQTGNSGKFLTTDGSTASWASVSGVTVETPTGTVDASNTTFTPTSEPKWVVSDGTTYFDGAGYTWNGTTIEMTVPPSSFIRDII